ncbi:MAG: hypothetical protein WB661_00465, partial [Candidatus Bathyarchaeia archaeon]
CGLLGNLHSWSSLKHVTEKAHLYFSPLNRTFDSGIISGFFRIGHKSLTNSFLPTWLVIEVRSDSNVAIATLAWAD